MHSEVTHMPGTPLPGGVDADGTVNYAVAMERIAVIAHKGGTGKTTVALNLGAELAASGLRVVLIDCDPQGGLGISLGQDAIEKPTLYEVVTGQATLAAATKPTGIERLSLVGADLDLSGLEVELPQQRRRVGALRNLIERLDIGSIRLPDWQNTLRNSLESLEGYDIAVIDTAPGLGILSYVALVASTAALIVMPPEHMAFRALRLAMETFQRAKERVPDLRLVGIVPTMTTQQTRHAREVLEALRTDHGELVLPEIPRRVVVQDAALAGKPVRDYAPTSGVAQAFSQLAREVLARLPSP